jgi:hypothetical protein
MDTDLWLDPIRINQREKARRCLADGNFQGFLEVADREVWLSLVNRNRFALRDNGILERALVRAITITPTNHHGIPVSEVRSLFDQCDPQRLRDAGDLLPDGDRFVVYRGVAGEEPFRKENGWSWTGTLEVASFFAQRPAGEMEESLADPAVLKAVLRREEILVYTFWEDEFLCFPRSWVRLPDPLPTPREPGPWLPSWRQGASGAGG